MTRPLPLMLLACSLALAVPALAQTDAPPPPDPNAGQPTGAVSGVGGMVPAPADVPRDSAAPVGSAANPIVEGGNVTPPPPPRTSYPPCSRTVKDSCRNPGGK